jgi:hypothetical protein
MVGGSLRVLRLLPPDFNSFKTIDNVIYMYIYFDENLIKSKLAKI